MLVMLGIFLGAMTAVGGIATTLGLFVYSRVADRAEIAATKAAENATLETQHWDAHTRQITSLRTHVDDIDTRQREVQITAKATEEFRTYVTDQLHTVSQDLKELTAETRKTNRVVDRLVDMHSKPGLSEPVPSAPAKE
jgi:hypothetical protein